MRSNHLKTIGLLSILLLTFGITAFNFDNPNFRQNTKAYIMLALGIVTLLFFIAIRLKSRAKKK